MARIFVTGSADGLGLMAARLMVEDGYRVVLHGRNEKRAKEALAAVPGAETQVWLATSNDPEAMVSGQYFYHRKRRAPEPAARDEKIQERLIAECARISGVPFPA